MATSYPQAISTTLTDAIGVLLEQWRQRAEAAFEGALKEREADPTDGQLAAALQRIGELSMEVELLRAKMGRPGPLARRRSR